jgi:energy-coupling factor transport system substrate-specific component
MYNLKKLTISELVFITTISTVMGVFWWAYTFIYDILSPFLRASGLEGGLTGIWLMGGLFFPYIIRKPGSAILGEGIAAIIEGVISQWGVGAILYGALQGIPVEIFFLILRYKRFDMKNMCIAGVISGVSGCLVSIYLYQYYKLGISYCLIQLASSAVSGIILGGVLSKYLADNLAKTGVLNQFNIVGAQYKSKLSN